MSEKVVMLERGAGGLRECWKQQTLVKAYVSQLAVGNSTTGRGGSESDLTRKWRNFHCLQSEIHHFLTNQKQVIIAIHPEPSSFHLYSVKIMWNIPIKVYTMCILWKDKHLQQIHRQHNVTFDRVLRTDWAAVTSNLIRGG